MKEPPIVPGADSWPHGLQAHLKTNLKCSKTGLLLFRVPCEIHYGNTQVQWDTKGTFTHPFFFLMKTSVLCSSLGWSRICHMLER